ncbi:glycosyltransferase [Lactobacillus paragasseri]|uniref:glycosyltransferase n=1 Tax=Lactobacillus paragasseri TaxID=2107999 RepID=UPI0012E1D2CA|nr:glycosyltransferase [Lactobacillus paragasseri]MDK8087262.1 glycosyltransferase [Lactobacillus paragasseri]MDX5119194.1 glycosyltransferase [Lactobacillus paragasseri]MDX5123074.1 glycosyltransferase [Lactobacillus paragasseri]QGT97864.1 glycosyltransferase family 1 protein [Lactobacillus paragasseri]UWI47075.1 glycosyltransferase [Lactobacillus paragasseri]
MKKRLLVVGDFISGSGLTEAIFNIFSNFNSNKYDIKCVGYGVDLKGNATEKCKKLGWTLERVIPVTKRPFNHIKWWKKFFKKNDFDLVYFNYSSSWNYFPVKYAKRYTKARVVCHSHNSYYSHVFSNKILMKLLNTLNDRGKKILETQADVKIATSKDAAKWMFGTLRDVNIINNGIELKRFVFDEDARKELRDQLKIKENEKIVAFAGAFVNRKNPALVLQVFADYHAQYTDSKLLLIGKGPLEEKIKKMVSELKIEESVKFIPYTNILNKWYSAMDVLIFPSLYEGFGLVPLEAQVSNLPVLASSKVAPQVFATQDITKIEGYDDSKWNHALINIKFKTNAERKELNPVLEKFDIKEQVVEISKLLESER